MTQMQHNEKLWEKEDFINYLKQTLIPDLEESGMPATAEDFRTCIHFMLDDITVPIEFTEKEVEEICLM